MDIKEYIASGIIEGYVLGSLSDQERREVECMSAIYPELKAYVQENQRSFEEFAKTSAVKPPLAMKAKIMEAIANEPQLEDNSSSEMKKEAKVISMNERSQQFNWKWMVAASLGIALISSVMYFRTYSENEVLTADLNVQLQKNAEDVQKMDEMAQLIAQSEELEELVAEPSSMTVKLNGTEVSPESQVRLLYNTKMKKAVLTADNLPMPEKDKQYQLWALIDGKPMDLGVFEMSKDSNKPKMIKVDAENVQGFAITKERRGGSKVPTLDQMYVYGGVVASL